MLLFTTIYLSEDVYVLLTYVATNEQLINWSIKEHISNELLIEYEAIK